MKKKYIAPQTSVALVQPHALLSNSRSVWSDTTGLGYGGVDTSGGKDPSSRYHNSLWDDDDDDWLTE